MLQPERTTPAAEDIPSSPTLQSVLDDTLRAARIHDARQHAREQELRATLKSIERQLSATTSLKDPVADGLEDLAAELESVHRRAQGTRRWTLVPWPIGLASALALASGLMALVGASAGVDVLTQAAGAAALLIGGITIAHGFARRAAQRAEHELAQVAQRALSALAAARLMPEGLEVDASELRRAAQRLRTRHSMQRAAAALRELQTHCSASAPAEDLLLPIRSFDLMTRRSTTATGHSGAQKAEPSRTQPVPAAPRRAAFPRVFNAEA